MIDALEKFKIWLFRANNIHSVVDFNPLADQVFPFDFTAKNTELTDGLLKNTVVFSAWIEEN